MIIKSIRVRNFRSVKDETLLCENLTVLVGPNGSGKSSFLRALEIFYTPNARYTEDDFYARDTSQSILITATFTDLTDEEKKLFQKYIEGEEMTVEKELKWPPGKGSQKYYGTSLRNPEFQNFRSASGTAPREEYNKLRNMNKYSNFPSYTNRSDAERILSEWEQSHPDLCIRQRDDGQFFGFKEVGEAHLERYTKFIFIPAVRDATEDATEGRGSVVSEIMDLVVRDTLSQRKEIKEFKDDAKKRYNEIFNPSNLPELQNLEKTLSETLGMYVPGSRVSLSWHEPVGFDIPMPVANIRLVEDEYDSPVGHTGHGLQRAFILTMLQYLALAKPRIEMDNSETSSKTPNLIIGIEEPELYQHPNRQRHLSKVLMKLAREGIQGAVKQIQVIYSTHSPLLVNLENFEQVRVFRKEKKEKDMPKQTKIFSTSFKEVAKLIERADGKPEGTYTRETIKLRLKTIMTPLVNEGFFADLVVLVEGEEDKAAIIGTATAMEIDLESLGISVIPCMGKTCLDRPIAIFKCLQIPIYAIWDGDYGKKDAKPEENHRLLRLFNSNVEDWPETITDLFACFKNTLMDTFKKEIGEELFDRTLNDCCKNLGIGKKKYAIKNPQVIHNIIQEAKKQGKASRTLEEIVNRISSRASNIQ
ncbi:MAG: ATP-dependent endonuclease [Candidatus Jordarchaeaceae archaeon]